MFADFIPALLEFFTLNSLLFLMFGTLLGAIFGILPGIGGVQGMALLLPILIGMEPANAIVMLIGISAAGPTTGSITAILINTPGSSQSAATVFDGFPMTKNGQAGKALGASAAASTLGGIFGAIILTLMLPLAKPVILAFSFPENFMLALFGLTMISILSQGYLWKAFIAAGLGLMVSFVGYDPVTGGVRYNFGSLYLWEGFKLAPILIGMFAIGESINLLTQKGSIATQKVETSIKGVYDGVKSVFTHFRVFIQGSVVGTIIGIIPGVGGTVANFISYGVTVSTAKDKSNFGKGDVRGVIGPEAANNAKDGGSLIPTLFFGIPGSLDMAVFLGALTIFGIQPGPRLITDNPTLPLIIIYALVLSTIVVGIASIYLAPMMARLTEIKTTLISPCVIVLALVGSYATEGDYLDVIVTLVFGFVGYIMMRYGYSRIAFIMAIVLGGLFQTSYHQTMGIFGPSGFFTRPISLTLFICTLLIILVPMLKFRRKKV